MSKSKNFGNEDRLVDFDVSWNVLLRAPAGKSVEEAIEELIQHMEDGAAEFDDFRSCSSPRWKVCEEKECDKRQEGVGR